MALFQSGNPTLSQKIFEKSISAEGVRLGVMTVRGTMIKFGFMLLLVVAGAVYTWNLYYAGSQSALMAFFMVGIIGGLITGLIVSFNPGTARYLAPAYAILEGFVIGGLSAIVNASVSKSVDGSASYDASHDAANHYIVIQAVGLTFGVAIVMFLLYNFRIIKPTEKFKAVIVSSMLGILLLYVAYWLLGIFGVHMSFMSWNDVSPLGIGINLFVAVIAALSLILDFERIENGADMGAPKKMEWYGAFGLLVTMIWLYIQILKLLSRFSSRN